ncbi:MAG TPA: RagB/SusD family nutrient uptake outer membrane protein [Chitinophaga sp.]|uniref:RagB/SusD family nutrient uptake outer membrane protein n=1 Tax=Chitinophaga sp. TaxID=1869181 RepID=UPI002DBDE7CD|nr:RagB/SusD family nutrient uptake outer membrane protein [Chitinophaga sp.]HEU4553876.1 RagB/SusD family nutrient uptake outer membrane protein [Chitinophaga sp.]
MKQNHYYRSLRCCAAGLLCLAALLTGGCKKYLDLPLPLSTIAGSSAYTTDKSSAAVLNGIYARLMGAPQLFDGSGIGFSTSLYADELQSIGDPTSADRVYYQNAVQSDNTGALWTLLYKQLYTTNLVIEGVTPTTTATLRYRSQWLGEAYFIRALLHFYLVNLYGDAVIVTSSDYAVNNSLPRSTPQDVYVQIIKDLQQAQSLLTDEYKDGNGLTTTERGRPNKAAATALLARVYLYTKDWANAETQASLVIAQPVFSLPRPADVFLHTSLETVYALAPLANSWVRDYNVYNNGMPAIVPAFPASNISVAMSSSLVNAFEPGDERLVTWARKATDTAAAPVSYYFPDKYKSRTNGDEYIVMLRLAEQYLIRAEARVRLNKLTAAKQDLDAVRARAGLGGVTAAGADALLDAIMKERRTELFTEEGHRLFDLRRTGRLNAVMTPLTPQKGGAGWQPFMQWWPIPTNDIFANPHLTQTEGYQ